MLCCHCTLMAQATGMRETDSFLYMCAASCSAATIAAAHNAALLPTTCWVHTGQWLPSMPNLRVS